MTEVFEVCLHEIIAELEKQPGKSVPEGRFMKWLKALDHKSQTIVIHHMKRVHQKGM
jgi:hypothetical protein